MMSPLRLAVAGAATLALSSTVLHAQLFKLTREQVTEITADNPFERFPDGRPTVSYTHLTLPTILRV